MDSKNVSKSNYQNLHAEKCQICGVIFSNPDILSVHKEFVHDYLEKLLHGDTGFKDYKDVKKGWTVIGNATRENLSPNGQDTTGRNMFKKKEGENLFEENTTDLRKEADKNENVQQKKIEEVHKAKNSNIDDFKGHVTKDTNERNIFEEEKDLIEENTIDFRKETDKNENVKAPDSFGEQNLENVQQEKVEEIHKENNFNIDNFWGNSEDKKKYSEDNNISNSEVATTQDLMSHLHILEEHSTQELRVCMLDCL